MRRLDIGHIDHILACVNGSLFTLQVSLGKLIVQLNVSYNLSVNYNPKLRTISYSDCSQCNGTLISCVIIILVFIDSTSCVLLCIILVVFEH